MSRRYQRAPASEVSRAKTSVVVASQPSLNELKDARYSAAPKVLLWALVRTACVVLAGLTRDLNIEHARRALFDEPRPQNCFCACRCFPNSASSCSTNSHTFQQLCPPHSGEKGKNRSLERKLLANAYLRFF